jgi:hypothetical protein
MKKILFIILIIVFQIKGFCQKTDFVKIILGNKNNLEITTSLGHIEPSKIYILNTIDKWGETFNVKRDLSKYEVDPYIFSDTTLQYLFTEKEINNLYQRSKIISKKKLTTDSKLSQVVNSFDEINEGFFFSFTQPVYSSNGKYAFIEMTSYYKEKKHQLFNETYFGDSVFVYKYLKGSGWKLFKKQELLLL